MKNYRSSGKASILLDLLSDPALIVDEKGDFLNVNSAFEEVTGLSRKELIGSHFSKLNILTAEMKAALSEILKKRIQGEPNEPYEVCFTGKAGETHYVEVKERKIRYAGQPAYLNVLRDVTDRKKKTDEQIRSSEEKYKNLFENAPDVIVTFDLTGKITSVNKAIMQHGFRENEIVGNSIFKLVPIEYNQKMLTGLKNIAAGNPAQGEIEILTPNGKRSAEYNSNPIWLNGKVVGYQTIIRDVTERKKAEESLEKEQQELNRIIDSSPVIIFYKDKEGKFVRVNEAFAEALKIPKEKFFGKTVFDFYSAEIARGMANDDLEVLQSGRPKLGIIEQYESASGMRWVQTDKVPILDKNGISTGLIGFAQDITERKKAEDALRESEEKHRRLFEESMDAIFMADAATGIIVDCNPAASKLVGREKSELVGQHQYIIHPKEQIEGKFSRSFKQHLKDPTKILETQIMRKTGEIRDVAVSGTTVELKGKKLIQGIFRDITERKQSEQKLREAEKRYRALFDQAPLGVLVVDPETTEFVEFNDVANRQLGYSKEEFAKLRIADIEAKETIDEVKTHTSRMAKEGGGEFETKHYTKDGEIRDVLVTTRAIELRGKTFLNAIFRDITDIRKIQDALMKSETQYRQLVNVAQEGIWALDSNYRTVFVNPRMAQMLGYAESEMVGKSLFDFLDARMVEAAKRFLGQDQQGTAEQFEYEFQRKDGTRIYTSISASQITDDDGKRVGTLALIADITERKKAESSLKSSEEKFRNLAEQSPNIIFINQKGKVVYANTEAEKATGYKKEEFYSPKFNFMDLIAPESKEFVKSQFIKHMKGEDVHQYEYKLISKKGRTIDVINSFKNNRLQRRTGNSRHSNRCYGKQEAERKAGTILYASRRLG